VRRVERKTRGNLWAEATERRARPSTSRHRDSAGGQAGREEGEQRGQTYDTLQIGISMHAKIQVQSRVACGVVCVRRSVHEEVCGTSQFTVTVNMEALGSSGVYVCTCMCLCIGGRCGRVYT